MGGCHSDPSRSTDAPSCQEHTGAARAAGSSEDPAHDELTQACAFLRQVLDLDPNLIFAKDRQGRFTLVNRATAAAYGTTVDELLGKTDADYNGNAEEVSNFRRDDLEVMTTGRDKLIPEERITDASGRLRWLRTIKRAVVSSDGSVDQVVGIASDITELKKVEDDLRRRTQLFVQQQVAFLELARMVPDQLEDAFRRIASVAARTLDVGRVGIWLFSEDHSTIVCACLHAAEGAASSVGVGSVLDVGRFPRYFEALAESRTIAAHDARRDPKTSEFTQTYLEPIGITSMLDVPVFLHGKVIGVVCHEHIGEAREWTLEEEAAASSIADFVSLTMEADKRRRLEEQLRQSQKMEAVGLLAGGVAHDFNNLLNVIMGYAELAHSRLPAASDSAGALRKVLTAASRAAELTSKLLAFSRRQVLTTELLDANQVVDEFSRMVARILGEDVEVVVRRHPDELVVRVDRSQLEQVLLNLCTNARQAMPQGGRLVLETDRVSWEDGSPPVQGARSGEHLRLRVADTGVGMSPEVLPRIWEPFFTTKSRGTGLGLSMVYGIVQQHQGFITVESEVGRGTLFSIYLPLMPGVTAPRALEPAVGPPLGQETILLAEDETMLRDLVAAGLEALGYRVLCADNGQQAIDVFEEHRSDIALLILDVVMPKLSGPEVLRRIRQGAPAMRAVFVSGYAPDRHSIEAGNVGVLAKPFSLVTLAQRVRETLDAGSSPALRAQT